jgi:hypothetical protein
VQSPCRNRMARKRLQGWPGRVLKPAPPSRGPKPHTGRQVLHTSRHHPRSSGGCERAEMEAEAGPVASTKIGVKDGLQRSLAQRILKDYLLVRLGDE